MRAAKAATAQDPEASAFTAVSRLPATMSMHQAVRGRGRAAPALRARPGELLHLDVRKLGRIPPGGGKRFAPGFAETRIGPRGTGGGGPGVRAGRVLTDNGRNYPARPSARRRCRAVADAAVPAADRRQGRGVRRDSAGRVGVPAALRPERGGLAALPVFLREHDRDRPRDGAGGAGGAPGRGRRRAPAPCAMFPGTRRGRMEVRRLALAGVQGQAVRLRAPPHGALPPADAGSRQVRGCRYGRRPPPPPPYIRSIPAAATASSSTATTSTRSRRCCPATPAASSASTSTRRTTPATRAGPTTTTSAAR